VFGSILGAPLMAKNSPTAEGSRPLQFLRQPAVERVTGLPRSSLYWLIAQNDFPRPVPLGKRAVGWVESEIEDWLRKRVARRDSRDSRPEAQRTEAAA
jgi:prophage regulatory protein